MGGHAQVRLTGRKVGVSQQRLDLGQAGAVIHEQGGIGVPKAVSERTLGRDHLGTPVLAAHEMVDGSSGERFSARPNQQFIDRLVSADARPWLFR
jgi:hypothetical protein